MFPTILIVDDEPAILQSLGGILSDEGFEVISAENGYEALKRIEEEPPDLVLLDIWMPGLDGIDTLKEVRKEYPFLPVVLITGHGTVETAVQAIKLGAYDFIEKPLSIEKVVVTISNALHFRRLEEENKYLRKKTLEKNQILGISPPIQDMQQQIQIAAPTEAGILIFGENGTGKELVARTIHSFSNRSEQPMVTVNCASMSTSHLESELFGHEKGAFDGAKQRKRGRFEMAHGGTLFFDEIGDMDTEIQGKILRALEDKSFSRMGGGRTLRVDARIIASTNKNLEEEITREAFREDLYYRLNVIPITVPTLRERSEDIPLLCQSFFKQLSDEAGDPPKTMTPEALAALAEYPWPGNVRELKNLCERLVITVDSPEIALGDIPVFYRSGASSSLSARLENLLSLQPMDQARKAFDHAYARFHLDKAGGDEAKAAAGMGVGQSALKKLMK